MSITRIKVRREDDSIIVHSNDINVKQAFFSWGSFGTGTGKKEFPEFYGCSIETRIAYPANEEMWQWVLTEDLTRELIRLMSGFVLMHLDGSTPETKASQYVIKALTNCLNGEPEDLDEFTRAYIEAALWSTTDESTPDGGYPLEQNYGVFDIAPEALSKIKADCQKFQEENADLLVHAYELYIYNGWEPPALAGHDFWLTRCGHGVGFWDRGLGEVGEKLTEASKRFGECWIVVGEDGQLHDF